MFIFTGEAKRYMYLHQATLKCLADEDAANQSTKVRILELEGLNKSNETKIEEIKTQIVDSVTVNQNQWSFWRTKKTTFYEMVIIYLFINHVHSILNM